MHNYGRPRRSAIRAWRGVPDMRRARDRPKVNPLRQAERRLTRKRMLHSGLLQALSRSSADRAAANEGRNWRQELLATLSNPRLRVRLLYSRSSADNVSLGKLQESDSP